MELVASHGVPGGDYRLFVNGAAVALVDRRGRSMSDASSSRWDATAVIDDGDGFDVLLEGSEGGGDGGGGDGGGDGGGGEGGGDGGGEGGGGEGGGDGGGGEGGGEGGGGEGG